MMLWTSSCIRRFEAGVFDGLIFEFELKEPVSLNEVSKIEKQLPDLEGRTLIISGKGPAWLYCMIMRKYLCRFPVIAVYDPDLQAAIIVSSHLMSFKMGEQIKVNYSLLTQGGSRFLHRTYHHRQLF